MDVYKPCLYLSLSPIPCYEVVAVLNMQYNPICWGGFLLVVVTKALLVPVILLFFVEILGFCIDIDIEYFLPLSSFWLYATIFSPLKLAAHCHQCR